MAARNFISSIAGLGGGAALATGHTATGVAAIGVAGAAMGGSAVRKVLSARAMMNPATSKWLAQAATVTNRAEAKASIDRLGRIISREPALAGELTPLHQFLTQSLRPVAASDEAQPD